MDKLTLKTAFNNYLCLFCILIVFLQPSYLQSIGIILRFYRITSTVILVILVIWYIYARFRKSSILNLLILLELYILINTIIQGGNISACFFDVMTTLGLCLTFEFGMEYNSKKFLIVLYCILYAFVIINFLSLVIFPNGMYTTGTGLEGSSSYASNWFLGYKNYHVRFFLPTLLLSEINCLKNEKIKLDTYILYIICWISSILNDSSTGLIGMAIFTLGSIVLFKYSFLSKFVNIYTVIGSILIVFFLIVVGNTANLPILKSIAEFFGKDLTLSDRTYIWANSIDIFKQKPLFGYGYFNASRFQMINHGWGTHPHNYILYILVQGGIIEAVIVFLLFFRLQIVLRKYKKSSLPKLMTWFYACMLIMGLTESLINTAILFYPFLIICWYAKKISMEKNMMRKPKYKLKLKRR